MQPILVTDHNILNRETQETFKIYTNLSSNDLNTILFCMEQLMKVPITEQGIIDQINKLAEKFPNVKVYTKEEYEKLNMVPRDPSLN